MEQSPPVAVVGYCLAVAAEGLVVLVQVAALLVALCLNCRSQNRQTHHRQNHPGGQPTQPPARNAVESLEGR